MPTLARTLRPLRPRRDPLAIQRVTRRTARPARSLRRWDHSPRSPSVWPLSPSSCSCSRDHGREANRQRKATRPTRQRRRPPNPRYRDRRHQHPHLSSSHDRPPTHRVTPSLGSRQRLPRLGDALLGISPSSRHNSAGLCPSAITGDAILRVRPWLPARSSFTRESSLPAMRS
jgi:hypothetical protein